jgi:WhiB family redox-sensing transcriptional regulator
LTTATATRQIPSWPDHAACKGVTPSLFYPEKGGGHSDAKRAKAFCNVCPVRAECLADELERGITGQYGVRGGTTPEQRRKMIRDQNTTTPRE